MNNMRRTSAIAIAAALDECGFPLHHCQSLAMSFFIWQLLLNLSVLFDYTKAYKDYFLTLSG